MPKRFTARLAQGKKMTKMAQKHRPADLTTHKLPVTKRDAWRSLDTRISTVVSKQQDINSQGKHVISRNNTTISLNKWKLSSIGLSETQANAVDTLKLAFLPREPRLRAGLRESFKRAQLDNLWSRIDKDLTRFGRATRLLSAATYYVGNNVVIQSLQRYLDYVRSSLDEQSNIAPQQLAASINELSHNIGAAISQPSDRTPSLLDWDAENHVWLLVDSRTKSTIAKSATFPQLVVSRLPMR